MKHAVAAVVLIAATAVRGLVAQTPPPEESSKRVEVPPPAPSPYRLNAGDTIQVKFPYNNELDETVIIRPDGAISLQLVGEIQAESLRPAELATLLRDRYAKFLKNPEVAVIVREFAAQRIYVGGEVANPGLTDLRGRLTLLQAIVGAGGIKPSGKSGSVLLIRRGEGSRAEVRKINMKRILGGRDADVVLQPFDVLYVPQTVIARVGLFVNQHISSLIPSNLTFAYNLNSPVVVRD